MDYDVPDDEYKNKNRFHVHEGIVLALYLTPEITQKLTSIFTTFLNLLKTLVKSAQNTGLGLYIFNCSKKNEDEPSESLNGIYHVFKLEDLNASMLYKIDCLLDNSVPKEDPINFSTKENNWEDIFPILHEDFKMKFGESLCSMFDQVSLDFNSVQSNTDLYTSKKMFLITDCLSPFNGNGQMKKILQTKLRKLNEDKITVYPFIISNGFDTKLKSEREISFDIEEGDNIFNEKKDDSLQEFRQLFDFPLDNDLISGKYVPAIDELKLDMLEEKMIKRATVKRLAFECPLIFGKLKIFVKGLNVFTSVEWNKVKVFDDNGRKHTVHRKATPHINGKPVVREDIESVVNITGQYFPIDDDIKKECMKFGQDEKPILHVIGTRKFEKFNPSYTINKSLFMIADESKDDLSLARFAAIYKSLCKKNMMILCWGMIRSISYPRFYYLIPTGISDKYDLPFSTYPSALAMIEIPFGDEVRKAPDYINEIDPPTEIDDSKIMDELVDSLTNEKFTTFLNPSLAWKADMIERSILNTPIPTDYEESILKMDDMYQRILQIQKKIESDESLIQIVNTLVSRYNRLSANSNLKRQLVEPNERMKKVKIESLDDESVVVHYNECKLQNCTVKVLKSYIKSKNGAIFTGRSKDECIQNISIYLSKNGLL